MKMTDKYAWLLGAAIAVAAPASGDVVTELERKGGRNGRRGEGQHAISQPDDGVSSRRPFTTLSESRQARLSRRQSRRRTTPC